MSLLVQCSECGSSHRVNDRLAGRRVNCPGCGQSLAVPETPPELSPSPVDAEPVETEPVETEPVETEPVGPEPGDPPPHQLEHAPHSAASPMAGVSGRAAEQPPSSQTRALLEELDEDDELPRRKPREDEELDMTPMVDVTFLLLIFFMVTASFSLQKSIQMPRQQTDAPSTSAKVQDPEQLEPVELEIDQYGGFLVLAPDWERETPGKQNLITALKEAAGDNPDNMVLSIKVHEMARLQSLVDGMDAGTVAGFTELQVTQVDGF